MYQPVVYGIKPMSCRWYHLCVWYVCEITYHYRPYIYLRRKMEFLLLLSLLLCVVKYLVRVPSVPFEWIPFILQILFNIKTIFKIFLSSHPQNTYLLTHTQFCIITKTELHLCDFWRSPMLNLPANKSFIFCWVSFSSNIYFNRSIFVIFPLKFHFSYIFTAPFLMNWKWSTVFVHWNMSFLLLIHKIHIC